MKLRSDFITNSSSSSFIISRDDISRDKLLEILLEIANMERNGWTDEKYTWDDDVYDDRVTYRYRITEATQDRPEKVYNEWDDVDIYDNHFIIDNDGCMRYNWNVIEQVLNKYNIPFTFGYCD